MGAGTLEDFNELNSFEPKVCDLLVKMISLSDCPGFVILGNADVAFRSHAPPLDL